MSYLSEHIIPGGHGKIFATNAIEDADLFRMKQFLLKLDGITDINIVTEVFPREFVVKTSKSVEVSTIQDAVIKLGFHAIPKGLFPI